MATMVVVLFAQAAKNPPWTSSTNQSVERRAVVKRGPCAERLGGFCRMPVSSKVVSLCRHHNRVNHLLTQRHGLWPKVLGIV
jgi:hypothetical protein